MLTTYEILNRLLRHQNVAITIEGDWLDDIDRKNVLGEYCPYKKRLNFAHSPLCMETDAVYTTVEGKWSNIRLWLKWCYGEFHDRDPLVILREYNAVIIILSPYYKQTDLRLTLQ